MTVSEGPPVRGIRAAVTQARDRATALLTGENRQELPGSVLVPRRVSLQKALEAEAQGLHPIVLAVGKDNGRNKGSLISRVSAMAGEGGQTFRAMYFAGSFTSGRMVLNGAFARGTEIGVVVIDAEVTEGEGDWTDIVRTAREKYPTVRIILFGNVDPDKAQQLGVNRVVANSK